MKSVKQCLRLLKIYHIFSKNAVDKVLNTLPLSQPLRWLIYLNPARWFHYRKKTSPEASFRITLEELGPIFVKFGQALSTRPDILSASLSRELNKLQDKVPPFSSEIALATIESTFGTSAFNLFSSFDPEPLASASIAQVHAATLKSGDDVVVKILRPNIRKLITDDLAILKTIAHFIDKYWSGSKRFKPKEIVKEFEQSLLDELDLQREAANGAQLRRNFSTSPWLYVPEMHWDYVRTNILVMERIYGIAVSDVATLKQHNIDMKKLAERGMTIFFTQVFRDCFFHADMHAGNIFVSPNHPDDPQYICIDFGIMGTLNESDQRYLAENLLAFFNRDYRKIAALHIESGWVSRDTPINEFESTIRTVCEPIFEKPLKDISFALVMLQLFQVARRFHMVVQPQLVLLQKTLLAVEGLGRQLYPELDLWSIAKPFLERWLRQQLGPKVFIKHLKENLPFFLEQLPHMPRLLNDVLTLTREQQLLAKEHNLSHSAVATTQKTLYRGAGAGIFIVMLAVSGLNYFHWVTPMELTHLCLGVALLGGFTAWLYNKK